MLPTMETLLKRSAHTMLGAVAKNDTIRGAALKVVERRVHNQVLKKNPDKRPLKAQEDRFFAIRNLLYAINRALSCQTLSPQVRKKVLDVLVGRAMLGDNEAPRAFREKYGQGPPAFIALSPEQKCNLKCVGCYAASSPETTAHLDYEVVDRILTEKRELWGSYFTVITGGEPLLWRSNGKGILDLFKDHSDNYFLMYTNGTLINEKVAETMTEVGNVTPAISVEGFEAETDKRRGKGVHKRILKAFENLRGAGVPFGISVTATRENAEILLSDEMVDYYFHQQGAIYCWIFQYMPIGRSFTLNLMVTPEQRLELWRREQVLLREKGLFIADFWNSGPGSSGCISGGRPGGYLYINWHGTVSPCAFFPYSVHNIVEVYKRGGDLNTILFSPFFESIRKWQRGYGYGKPCPHVGNQIIPCPMRDHHRLAHGIVKKFGARPVDEEARQALEEPDYFRGMCEYDREVERLTNPIWQSEYLGNVKTETAEARRVTAAMPAETAI
jgi:MoaA/NifB/PqqE/SkfB family radical SAM enzyme